MIDKKNRFIILTIYMDIHNKKDLKKIYFLNSLIPYLSDIDEHKQAEDSIKLVVNDMNQEFCYLLFKLHKKLLPYIGVYITNNWQNINDKKLKKLFIYNNVISMFFYNGGNFHPSKYSSYKDLESIYEEIK